MRKALEIGGYVAAAVLIAFGIAAIYMGVQGRSTVSDSIKNEQIVGSADMTPSGIAAEAKAVGTHQRVDSVVQRRQQVDPRPARTPGASPSTCGSTRSSRAVG